MLDSVLREYFGYFEGNNGLESPALTMAENIVRVMQTQALTVAERTQLMGVLTEIVGNANLAEAYVGQVMAAGENENNGGIKFFRVQGGIKPNRSKPRITIMSDGRIRISDKNKRLYISAGSSEHATYFKAKRGEGAVIFEFEVPNWFYNFLKESAISQRNYNNNPLNQSRTAPQLVDPTKPGESYELPPPWIEWLEEYAYKGRILTKVSKGEK